MGITQRFARTLAVSITLLVAEAGVAREWTDVTGRYEVEAEFVSLANESVTLRRADQRTIVVPVARLSAADREFVQQQAGVARATDAATPIELIEVTINQPQDDPEKLAKKDLMPHSGVTMEFEVPAGERHFIGFDPEANRIIACSDDRGTDLTTETRLSLFYEFNGPLDGTVYEGGEKCIVLASVPGVPAAGAKQVTLEATVAIRCAQNTKTVEQRDIALVEGSEITVGPVPLKIESVKDYDREGFRQSFKLVSGEPIDAIKSIGFRGLDGKVIVHKSVGGLITMCGDDCYRHETEYALRQKVDRVTVRVTYYSDVELYTVPVKIETSEGL